MVFIPIGLHSKIKDPPYLVAIIVVITAFVSITHFKKLDRFSSDYVNSSESQNYFYQLRSVYVNACDVFQPTQTCDLLIKFKNDDVVRNAFLANDDAKRYLVNAQEIRDNLYSNWHSEEFMRERLREHNRLQELNELVLLSLTHKRNISALHKKYGLLSRHNLHILPVMKAQFTHSDWFHLLGNLVFFLFFGACIEQAMGRSWLLGVYFIGGTLGLISQLALGSSENVYVIGASANIFACAGAFLRLYWKQPLELLFSLFFVVNKTIHLPTWSFFLFFVVIQQISGLTDGGEGNVAYLAHIVGLAYGFSIAHYWAHKKQFVPSKYLIFPYEKEMLASVESRAQCKDKFNALVDLVFYAPNNIEAYEKFHKIHMACGCDPRCLSDGSRQFVGRQTAIVIKQLLLDKNLQTAAHLFSKSMDMGCDAALVLREMTVSDVMTLGNHFYHLKAHAVLDHLFSGAIKTFKDEHKRAFEQFADSIKRERGGENAS